MYSFEAILPENDLSLLDVPKAERVAEMKRGKPYKWQNEK